MSDKPGKMSAEEINRAIAEELGWKPCYKGCGGKTWRFPDDTGCQPSLPNFTGDLNACAEMRKALDPAKNERSNFADNLRQLLGFHVHDYFDLVDACAELQCKAFLRVKGRKL